MRARTPVVALGALALGVFAPRGATASPAGMYGFGSRSSGLGGAVSADVSDFSANYYNPAGLVRATTMRIDLGYFYAGHQLATNGLDNHVDPAHGLVGGVSAPGRLFSLPFAFGLAVHLPDDRLSRSRSLPQLQPRWELYDNRVQILSISANVAIAPFPWLRLGGGLSFVSSTRGTLNITGQITYPDPSASQLTHTVDADLQAVRYPQAGIQVDVLPTLTIAGTYRGSYSLALGLDATVGGQIILGSIARPLARVPGAYVLSSQSTAVYLPQQAVLGAAWHVKRTVTLLADLTFINYAAYENPTAQLTTSLRLDLPPNLRGAINIPALPPSTQRLPASFANTFTPRVAVEWNPDVGRHTLSVRGAYRYDPTPVPPQTGATNFLDANRHVVSAGFGVMLRGMQPTLAGGISIDVHAEMQFLEDRVTHKDAPNDPIGDYRTSGYVWSVGATTGVLF